MMRTCALFVCCSWALPYAVQNHQGCPQASKIAKGPPIVGPRDRHKMQCAVVIRAAVVACAIAEVAGFSANAASNMYLQKDLRLPGLRRGEVRRGICMKDDDINTKKVAG